MDAESGGLATRFGRITGGAYNLPGLVSECCKVCQHGASCTPAHSGRPPSLPLSRGPPWLAHWPAGRRSRRWRPVSSAGVKPCSAVLGLLLHIGGDETWRR